VKNIGWKIAHIHSKFELYYNSRNPTLYSTTLLQLQLLGHIGIKIGDHIGKENTTMSFMD